VGWGVPVNFNVEEWDAKGQTYEMLSICRSFELARAAFAAAIAEKPIARFMIRSRTRVVKRHPEGDRRERRSTANAITPKIDQSSAERPPAGFGNAKRANFFEAPHPAQNIVARRRHKFAWRSRKSSSICPFPP
jgi:hypothetical protein